MAKEWARAFYSSERWKQCRRAYWAKARGLCERCLAKGVYKPGEIVHHKTHLTPENITDPTVTLSFDNLQLVCRECHEEIHRGKGKRYQIAPDGSIIIAPYAE